MGRRGGKGILWAIALSATTACDTEPPVPGDETMGHFAFAAARVDEGDGGCNFRELNPGASFAFEGTFSRFENGTGAWFTVNGVSRESTWDGQVFESPYTADRRFEQGDDGVFTFSVRENLKVALLSESQAARLGDDCAEDVLPLLQPGGVPVDPDAGVFAPRSRPEGFDAARACGLLEEEVKRAGAEDPPCALVFRVEGVRRR